jgi:phosphoserine phosphatase
MTCLHVFDMDGTLLVGSACIEISRYLGFLDEAHVIQDEWNRGELSDNEYWERCLPLWDGITEEQIDKAFAATQWLDGIETVFNDIQSRNEHSIVISQSPKFFVERLYVWGLGTAFGAEVTPGNPDGAEQMVSSEDKLKITRHQLRELDLDDDNCVVYGDSNSDLALFEQLTHTVAVNANEQIRNLATVTYDGSDLWAAYSAARELIENDPGI